MNRDRNGRRPGGRGPPAAAPVAESRDVRTCVLELHAVNVLLAAPALHPGMATHCGTHGRRLMVRRSDVFR